MTDSAGLAAVKFHSIEPQLIVPDVVAAAEYYRDVLGFRISGYFLDPPVFAIIARDDVRLHLGKIDEGVAMAPNSQRRECGVDVYIWVSDIDQLYAEFRDRGANIREAPFKTEYGCYELSITDAYGYRLVFAKNLSAS